MGNQFWTDFMVHTKPIAKCPFNMKSIMVTNATIDFGYIANLPIDGYTWILLFKCFQPIKKARYQKSLLYCGTSEITITKNQMKNKSP